MKTLIVYASIHHGNTEKIAQVLAQEMKATLVRAKDLDWHDIKEYDRVGFGSGIYFLKHHQSLFAIVKSLHGRQHKKAFIFSTSGTLLPWKHFFHGALRRALRGKGFSIAGEFACKGWDTVGPLMKIGGIAKGHPDEKDLKAARAFAKALTGENK